MSARSLEPSREDGVIRELGSVAVLGLGLLGGSLARDLAARGVEVMGYDLDPTAMRDGIEGRVLHSLLDDSLRGLETASVVVFAVPVQAAAELVVRAAPYLGRARLITDVGSTKVAIEAAMNKAGLGDRFVGSHPLAGDHRSGWNASRRGLFHDAPVYLCPTSTSREGAVAMAEAFWKELGGRPERTDAAAHDRRLAWSSHLPQAVSTALGLSLDGAGLRPGDLGPGGRAVTRLAGSSPAMWVGIAGANASNLAEAIADLEARLRRLRLAVERGDAVELDRIFQSAERWHRGG